MFQITKKKIQKTTFWARLRQKFANFPRVSNFHINAQSFDISLLFRLTWNKNNNNLIICVPGLWHSVLTSVLNGMHAVYIPYALMKVNPASWMQMITKYRGKHSGYHSNCFRNHGGLQRDK